MHCEPPLNDTDPQEVLDIWDWTKKTFRRSRDRGPGAHKVATNQAELKCVINGV
jgi:hypothetical protein